MYKRCLQLCMRYAQAVVNVQETPAAVYEICSGCGVNVQETPAAVYATCSDDVNVQETPAAV